MMFYVYLQLSLMLEANKKKREGEVNQQKKCLPQAPVFSLYYVYLSKNVGSYSPPPLRSPCIVT